MALDLGLTGKVAIISGRSEGLGRAAAERLAREGAKVTICARRKDVLEARGQGHQGGHRQRSAGAAGGRHQGGGHRDVVRATVERWGGVDILLNNAGTSAAAAFEKVDDDTWHERLRAEGDGRHPLLPARHPEMKKRGGGRIVNVTTVGGKAPAPRALPTSVSRAAGINLTKSLANEYAADKILVNTICIGLVRSAQIDRRAKDGDLEGHYRELAKRIPLGRVAHASEFGDLVAFLVSDRAAYITGTAINFDGGMAATV